MRTREREKIVINTEKRRLSVREYIDFEPIVFPLFAHYVEEYVKKNKITLFNLCKKKNISYPKILGRMEGKVPLDLKYIMYIVDKFGEPITLI